MTTIRSKILGAMILVSVGTVFLMAVLTSVWVYHLVVKVISDDRERITEMLATSMSTLLKEKEQALEGYVTGPVLRSAIREANERQAALDAGVLMDDILRKDKLWIAAGPTDAMVCSYLENPLSDRLNSLEKTDPTLAEIFVTDRYGGLAGASRKTSDFYQADEEWWQKVKAQKGSGIYVGDAEVDESSGVYALPLGIPVFDDQHEMIGVAKAAIDIRAFFNPLKSLRMGQTQRVLVVDEKDHVVFEMGLHPEDVEFLSAKEFSKWKGTGLRTFRVRAPAGTGKKRIVYFWSQVRSPLLSENGMDWHVCMLQDFDEVFSPAFVLLCGLGAVLAFALVISVGMGVLLGNRLSLPIRELQAATQRILKGDWNFEFHFKTGDEIEVLANTFRTMAQSLKTKQMELLSANREVAAFSKDLEKTVDERTLELSRSYEATLNILEDLTEAKKKLESALAIKSSFTSMVSHELRTPLGPIREGAGIILDGLTGPVTAQQKELLEMVRRNADRLNRLINDVLDFQKLDSGLVEFKMLEDDLGGVIRDVAETMGIMAREKKLNLLVEIAPDIPRIVFDHDKMIQVMTNLANNAIKFTDHGSVKFKAYAEANTVHVVVEDTGPGIRAEDMPRLFQSFQQLETTRHKRVGSTGLGLAISKEIVLRHHGKIWAESEFGKGASFHVVLPLVDRRGRNA